MGVELDLDRPPAPAARLVEAGVDGQAMEPGVEPIGVTQPRQVAPGSDEGLLDRVAGELRVPEDEAGGPVQPRDGPAGELGEGVMIALPRSLDESSLVHGRLGCRHDHGGRARQGMASGSPIRFLPTVGPWTTWWSRVSSVASPGCRRARPRADSPVRHPGRRSGGGPSRRRRHPSTRTRSSRCRRGRPACPRSRRP